MAGIPLELEYAKNTGITPEDVQTFRLWLKEQPHLPEEHITDLDIILALNCMDRDMEGAQQVLDLNMTLKTHFIQIFEDRSLDKRLLGGMDTVLFMPLKDRTPDGNAVMYIKIIDPNPKNFIFQAATRAWFTIMDCWQYKEGTWPGLIIVIDMDGVALGHIARLSLQTLQQFLYFLQEGMLVKLKSLHFANAPSFMDKLMMMLRPFLKKPLLDVLFIWTKGVTTYEKYYPTAILPKECGGEFKSIAECTEELRELVKTYEDFIIQENKKRVIEANRPGRSRNLSELLGGVMDSFKKMVCKEK